MPGPAVNPIAPSAPVANVKAATGKQADTAADGTPAKGSDDGFARELKRQLHDAGSADDRATADAKAAAAQDESAKPTETAADATPSAELAALLASAAPPPAPPAAVTTAAGDAELTPRKLAGEGIALQPFTGKADDKPAAMPTDLAAQAANLAAPPDDAATPPVEATTPSKPFATPALAADTSAVATPQHAAADQTAPAPANNFAAIHAAALANLRNDAAQPATNPVPLHVATPAGAPGWPEEVGNHIRWMAGSAESHAELTLTPPQLGKVEVSITISGDQTSAQIVTATQAARDLIEQSLPRLREVLEQSGINLGQTDVGTSGQPGSSGEGRKQPTWRSGSGVADMGVGGAANSAWPRRAEGLVDTFA